MIRSKSITCFAIMMGIAMLQASAQTHKVKIWIKSDDKVKKVYKIKDFPFPIEEGSEVKSEYSKTSDGKTYTISKIATAAKDFSLKVDTSIVIDMDPNAEGWANVRPDEKNPALLHVNYWLNPINRVSNGYHVEEHLFTMKADKSYSENTTSKVAITESTIFYLYKVSAENYDRDKGTTWFKNSKRVIHVFKGNAGNPEYYLVDRYDADADYQLKMENRKLLTSIKKGVDFGPLTIPIKYRFQRSKGDVIAPDEFIADFNIGIYAGYRLSKYTASYNTGEKITDVPTVGLSIGGFLNLGTVALDSLNTTIGKIPMKKDTKASIGTVSPGLGLMLSLSQVQVGLYTGWDIGFGRSASNWNYNNRPWIGFGIGLNLNKPDK